MSIPKLIEAWKQKPLEDVLTDLYIEQDLSIPHVAESLHISVGAVHSYLSKFNIYKEERLWSKTVDTDKKRRRKNGQHQGQN